MGHNPTEERQLSRKRSKVMNKRGQENSVNAHLVLLYEFDGLEPGVLKFNNMTANVVVC